MPAIWHRCGLWTMLILGAVGCGQEPPPASPPRPAPEAPDLTPPVPVAANQPVGPAPGVAPSGQVGPRVAVPWSENLSNPVVVIQDNQYQPYYTRVRLGGTVTWINRDRTTHSVMSPVPGGSSRAGAWSAVLAPGESYTRTFSGVTGTFTYQSSSDPGMRGNVMVIGDRRQDLFWSDRFAL